MNLDLYDSIRIKFIKIIMFCAYFYVDPAQYIFYKNL